MADEARTSTKCGDCGERIDEPGPPAEKQPCPNCGSTRRHHTADTYDEIRTTDEVRAEVSRATSAIRLAILATLLALGATAGFSAGFAEESVLLGLAWGIGTIIVSVPLLAFLLRVGWVREKTMAAMYWVAGE